MPCWLTWLPTRTDHADIVFYWIINLLNQNLFFVCVGCSLYVLVIMYIQTGSVICMYWLFFNCMYWWSCIFGGPSTRMSLLGRRWTDRLVCRRWADVGPTAWFADVEPTLDRPLGLPTLSRRWTVGQNYVGPPANVASGPTEWSTAVRRRTDSDVLSGKCYKRQKCVIWWFPRTATLIQN